MYTGDETFTNDDKFKNVSVIYKQILVYISLNDIQNDYW